MSSLIKWKSAVRYAITELHVQQQIQAEIKRAFELARPLGGRL